MRTVLKHCLQFQSKASEVIPFKRWYSSTHKSEGYISYFTFMFFCPWNSVVVLLSVGWKDVSMRRTVLLCVALQLYRTLLAVSNPLENEFAVAIDMFENELRSQIQNHWDSYSDYG